MITALTALTIAVAGIVGRLQAQEAPVVQQSAQAVARVPFGVGERLEYQIKAGFIGGSADMEVTGIDTIRGQPAWRTLFRIRGGIPGLRVNDRYESWIDMGTLGLLRHKRDIDEANYERKRHYEFFPERGFYVENGVDTAKTNDRPVDESSMLYFIRTLAYPAGLDTALNNYFILDRNPVRIKVIGRERIKVPAGEFDAIIIQPQIKAKGIFSEGGQARVWLSDDDRHIILQMKSKVPGFPFGSLNLYLKSYKPAPSPSSPRTP